MALSDAKLRSLKPQPKPYKVTDEKGLHVLVSTTGARSWRMQYRYGGKQKQVTFGVYPEVSLMEARSRRDVARQVLAKGQDPAAATKEIQPEVVTFGQVADELVARAKAKAESTQAKYERMLVVLVASLRPMPIRDITAADVLRVLQSVERRGKLETANRLRSMISGVFRKAISTLRADSDPTMALVGAIERPVTRSHPAITDEKAFGRLLVLIDEYDGWPSLTAALKFTALTMCRPGEVRKAEWTEIDFDRALWTVPAARMKMKREHVVPLSRQAIAVLHGMEKEGAEGLIFKSLRSGARALSENAMNSALRRMGIAQDEHCSHGFRSSASTILNDREFNPDLIEAALAHKDRNTIRAIYNRGEYLRKRAVLMQEWADLMDDLKKL